MVSENLAHKNLQLSEMMEELNKMKELGLPITAINLVSYLKSMISVVCMGKLGKLELAAGALAVGFTNITGYSVLSGLAMGMEPLCSQALGSGNLALVSSTLRRTTLMLLIVSIPIGFLWLNLESIMVQLRQDSGVARLAGTYCKFALPDLVANSLLHPLRVYFRSKGLPQPLMWCTALAVILHLPLTVFLTFSLDLGVAGVAAAASFTTFFALFLLAVYVVFSKSAGCCEELMIDCYQLLPDSEKNRSKWGPLIRLALPSCFGVCLEWWWYELMTLASGYLHQPRVSLAAAAIVIQTTSLMYTLPTTLSSSVSARVGNELGAGRADRARTAVKVAMMLAVLASCISMLWATLGREVWGKVFTRDADVLALTKLVLPVIGLCELANCPQTTGCGVLRGSARPGTGAAINLFSFYLIGAPVGLILAFWFDFGFVGLCFGLLAAQVVCAAVVTAVTLRTDWNSEAAKALNLVGTKSLDILEAGETVKGERQALLKEVITKLQT